MSARTRERRKRPPADDVDRPGIAQQWVRGFDAKINVVLLREIPDCNHFCFGVGDKLGVFNPGIGVGDYYRRDIAAGALEFSRRG